MVEKCKHLIEFNKRQFCFWNTESTYKESKKYCKSLNTKLVSIKQAETWLKLKSKANKTTYDYWTGFEYCRNKKFSENESSICKTYNFYDAGIRYNENFLRKALVIRFGLPWNSKPKATLGYIHKNVKKRFICESNKNSTINKTINRNISVLNTNRKRLISAGENGSTSTNNVVMIAVVSIFLALILASFLLLFHTKKGKKIVDNKRYTAARRWTDVKANFKVKKVKIKEAFNKKKVRLRPVSISDQQMVK